MSKFIIRGGNPVRGEHHSPGNKNAALPMIAACLLTDEPVILNNIPMIEDVRTMLELIDRIGVSVIIEGRRAIIHAKALRNTHLNPTLCRKVRSSILFAGPLASRHGCLTLPPPGGDIIGRRPVDTHFLALKSLGSTISQRGTSFIIRRRGSRMQGTRILLDEASVTATEVAIMAACLAEGETTIFNAACEPHVRDLCCLLCKMGAIITGHGTNLIHIKGVSSLHGAEHEVSPDYVDSASFLAGALLTGGELKSSPLRPDDWEVIARIFNKLNVQWHLRGDTLTVPAHQNLRVRADIGGAIPKIEDGPWPAFPSDLMSLAVVLATQAAGPLLFFEKMFESRLYFVDRLIEMGARIVPCDPHRVVVSGPARLKGITMASPDIRAGIALVLAGLCARGESIIENAQSIDRGYERVDDRLRALGADIVRVD